MVRAIGHIVAEPDQASEAMNEVMTVLVRRWDRIRKHPNPKALVLKICIDEAFTQLRKATKDRLVFSDELIEPPLDSELESDKLLIRKEVQSEIIAAISHLSEDQRQILVQRLFLDRSYQDIAASLHCSETSARQSFSRGRKRLSQLLKHLLPTLPICR